ncbi:DUF3667 domain-containing protein [Flavobacterium kingsejongi]|uniref:DUF3667 domain-containing protein n=1 Tax=Flavobacterium kingsejongi TaxID=1678728 RepID=A0A2S1LRU4_9FLAO|nr:DUF3667 domain-containing protein [Flavobacterium kingsejongi]AWG26449.1 hypothetical protein FK004_15065 [Flavobacterium kingsejongi]
MAHHHLRKDRTCLNCNYVVENRFCSRCGQENTETRQSFAHLVTHFFEDFTHYDNYFWKTIKTLLFKPAVLTKEYLAGKRQLYVPPVKLYIFISFITFLTVGLLQSDDNEAETDRNLNEALKLEKKDEATSGQQRGRDNDDLAYISEYNFNSIHEMDSIQKTLPPPKRLKGMNHWMATKLIQIKENTRKEGFSEKFRESFLHNVPKVLFIYMPFFAFGLWVMHNKKKWYFFDHGIFTLHYFSFLLISYLIPFLIGSLLSLVDWMEIDGIMHLGFLAWSFFYFFRSHSKFYGERKAISRLKGMVLFVINMFFITLLLLVLFIYSVLNIH